GNACHGAGRNERHETVAAPTPTPGARKACIAGPYPKFIRHRKSHRFPLTLQSWNANRTTWRAARPSRSARTDLLPASHRPDTTGLAGTRPRHNDSCRSGQVRLYAIRTLATDPPGLPSGSGTEFCHRPGPFVGIECEQIQPAGMACRARACFTVARWRSLAAC